MAKDSEKALTPKQCTVLDAALDAIKGGITTLILTETVAEEIMV